MRKEKVYDPSNPKLPAGKFFAWKSSDVSRSVVLWIINTYLLIFCTNTLGMDPVKAGTILFIANIIDMITDLVIGVVMDFSPVTRFGKYRPYEISILGITLLSIVLFFCPVNSSETFKVIFVFVFYTLIFGVFNTARSAAYVPYEVRAFGNSTALIGKVQSYGGILVTIASSVFILLFPKMINFMGSETAAGLSAEGWRKIILIYLIPLTLIGVCRFLFVKEESGLDKAAGHDRIHIKDILLIFKKNPYIWAFGAMIFAYNVASTLGALAYYVDNIFGNQGIMTTLSAVAIVLTPLLFLMPLLMRKLGAAKLIMWSAVLAASGYAIIFFAKGSFSIFAAGYTITGFVTLLISYLDTVLLVNIFNYTEYQGLPRMESTTHAVASGIFAQLGQGVGPFLAGIVLKATGFLSSSDGSVVTQPESAIFGIRTLNSIIPLCFMLVIIAATLILARLEHKMRNGMEAELAARREAKIAETEPQA